MNNSSSIVFTNATYYTEYVFKDAFFLYVYPVIIYLATITNTMCSIVLAQKELRTSGPFFQYSLANSIASALGNFLVANLFLYECYFLCPATGYSYFMTNYSLYAVIYMVSMFFIFSILVQLAISINLYLTMIQKFKRLNSVSPIKVIIGMAIASVIYGVIIGKAFKVGSFNYFTLYIDMSNQTKTFYFVDQETSSPILGYLAIFLVLVVNDAILVALIIFNFVIFRKMRQIMKKKRRLAGRGNVVLVKKTTELSRVQTQTRQISTGMVSENSMVPIDADANISELHTMSRQERKALKKTLIMFLWISIFFCSSRLTYDIENIVNVLMPNSFVWAVAHVINYFWTSFVYFSYLFVYLKTNKIFKKNFYRIFLRMDISAD